MDNPERRISGRSVELYDGKVFLTFFGFFDEI